VGSILCSFVFFWGELFFPSLIFDKAKNLKIYIAFRLRKCAYQQQKEFLFLYLVCCVCESSDVKHTIF
jgi:hypothetical protein